MRTERIKYLESKIPKDLDIDAKYGANFNKWASYKKNGIYHWKGVEATSPRELFLLGVLLQEGINFKQE